MKKNNNFLDNSYISGNPIITDFEYDRLNLKKQISDIKSMKSVFDWETCYKEYIKLGDGLKIIEPKLDGMTLLLEYQEGNIVGAFSKGNYGQKRNVLNNIISILPNNISYKKNIQFRGELIISKNNYKLIDTEFSSIRSATCGAVLGKNINFVFQRKIEFICFSVINSENKNVLEDKEEFSKYFKFVDSLAKETIYNKEILSEQLEIINNYEYPCDGIVIKLNNYEEQQKLGSTASDDKWLFAMKPNKEILSSRVIDIFYNVSKHGRIIPILKIEPLIFNKDSKIKVERIAGLSIPILIKKNIGINSIISVEIRSIAIPCLNSVLKSVEYQKILNCVSCGENLKNIEWCVNINCPEMLSMKLTQILKSLKIVGMGIGLVRRLINYNIKTFVDLLNIDIELLTKIVGNKKAIVVFEQLKNINLTANKIILSMSWPGIGNNVLKKIIKHKILNIKMLRQDLLKLNLGEQTSINLTMLLNNLSAEYDLLEFK